MKKIKKYNNILHYNWFDLCKFTKENNITFKDSLNYSLKNIIKSLHNNKLINLTWPNDDINGMEALIKGYNAHKMTRDGYIFDENLDEIVSYNEIDCKSLLK